MRLFANWLGRIPGREVAPTVLTALAVIGTLASVAGFVKEFAGSTGFIWG